MGIHVHVAVCKIYCDEDLRHINVRCRFDGDHNRSSDQHWNSNEEKTQC